MDVKNTENLGNLGNLPLWMEAEMLATRMARHPAVRAAAGSARNKITAGRSGNAYNNRQSAREVDPPETGSRPAAPATPRTTDNQTEK